MSAIAITTTHPLKASVHLSPYQTSKLFLIDTPPSSHATSPSSDSYPTLKGQPATLLSEATTETTFTTTTATTATLKKKIVTTRAPYHCTSKSVGQIIREISDVVDGRDKTIKVIQYFAKVFLWLFLSNPKQYAVLTARLKALAKQFSTTRKVLRLGHFIDPMASVLTLAVALRSNLRKQGLRGTLDKAPSQKWGNTVRGRLGYLNTVLGFVQDISDDIYCLGVIGVLDRSFSDKAEPWSNRLWMVGVTVDLHENLQTIRDVRKQIKALEAQMVAEGGQDAEQDISRQAQLVKLTTKLHWLKVTTVKLGGDFLFCGYDNLHCSFSDGFQAVTGFISGLAGAYKYVGKVME
ncbi:Peroxisomal membrane protein PMP27 [Linnemannia gamsii]|uniref:Peroxisomal membrane protein PMP27 n=1 Tax=Linnemannia gamsii TaxID=64522 RepID=A0ABQ7JPR0_9FUNG|nr:Peroxisomal membrane protein PMP27 [Linnemannia gamsii]